MQEAMKTSMDVEVKLHAFLSLLMDELKRQLHASAVYLLWKTQRYAPNRKLFGTQGRSALFGARNKG
jgi:hypothetical protein